MSPSFTVLKKRSHCYLSSKRVAYNKNTEQRLETNTSSKIYLQQLKSKVTHAYKKSERKRLLTNYNYFFFIQNPIHTVKKWVFFVSSSSWSRKR